MASNSPVWLVTGGSGQIGGAFAALAPSGVRVILPSRAELDLASDRLDIAPLLSATGATAIVNCAAYTDVDRAEDEPLLARRVNAAAPAALAAAAVAVGIPIVQVSTDYVFRGDKPVAYVEEDEPCPQGVYGQTKLDGERAVAASGARYAILRTSWVFSAGGRNFLRTMLRLGGERAALRVVADQRGCPTHAADFAAAAATVTRRLTDGGIDSGIWHVANAGETTWHGFAERIFARAAAAGQKVPTVEAIDSSAYPTRAVRPANSRLSTDRLHRDFGVKLRPWTMAVDEVTAELTANEECGDQ